MYRKVRMSNYRKIWEEFHNKKIPENYEIHHIDNNHDNNSIENLLLVSIEEHLEIHKSQEDWGAVQAILMRMENMQGIKEAASKHQKQLWESGNHNFQKLSKEHRSLMAKQNGRKTLESCIGIHAINADPTLAKENARRGGNASKDKKAGFLDTNSEKHGSKAVKGSKWWINKNGDRKRSYVCPGNDWVIGMIYNKDIKDESATN